MRFFLFFLVLNSTYGQSFAFCLFSCFFPLLPFHFSSFYVFFTPTFNRIIEALIFLLYNNFSIERGCLLWNQPREPVLMASQQVTTEIRVMPSLPIRFAIHIFHWRSFFCSRKRKRDSWHARRTACRPCSNRVCSDSRKPGGSKKARWSRPAAARKGGVNVGWRSWGTLNRG